MYVSADELELSRKERLMLWNQPHFFEQVRVNEETGTVEWPNGADFAPEFLYEIGKEVKQVA